MEIEKNFLSLLLVEEYVKYSTSEILTQLAGFYSFR